MELEKAFPLETMPRPGTVARLDEAGAGLESLAECMQGSTVVGAVVYLRTV